MAKRLARSPHTLVKLSFLSLAVGPLAALEDPNAKETPATRSADGPRHLAGDDAKRLEDFEKEIEKLRGEGAYERAIEIAAKAQALCVAKLGADAPRSAGARRLVETLRAIAAMPAEARADLAEGDRIDPEINELFYAAKYAEAEKLRERQVELRRRRLGSEHPELAVSLNKLAIVLMVQAKSDEALKACREALVIAEKSAGKEDEVTGGCLNTLGNLAQDRGDLAEAQALYERTLAIVRKSKGESTDLAAALGNLGTLHQSKGEVWTAEPLLREALEIHRRLPVVEDRRLAVAIANLAALLDRKGDYIGAEPLYRQALVLLEKASGPSHPRVAMALNNLAQLVTKKGDPAGAVPLYRRALEIARGRLDEEHPSVALLCRNFAQSLSKRGELGEAELLFRRSLAVRRKRLGASHPDVAESLGDLATLLIEIGQSGEAEPLLKEALEILEPKRTELPLEFVTAKSRLARFRVAEGAYDQAEALCREAVDLLRERLVPRHPIVALETHNLAFVLDLVGKNSEAERTYRETVALELELLGKDHASRAHGLIHLAHLLVRTGDRSQAGEVEALYQEAVELRRKAGDSGLHIACADYGDFLLHRAHRPEAAAALFAEAVAQLEELRAKVQGDEIDRAQYFGRISSLDPFGGLARANLAGAPPQPAAAFDAIERGRGRALLDLLDRSRQADPFEVALERLKASGKTAAAERFQDARRREIEASAARVSAERQIESVRRDRVVSAEERARTEQRLNGERTRARDAERLAARDAFEIVRSDFGSAGLRPRDAEAVSKTLVPAERMLVYDVGDHDSFVFVVTGAKARGAGTEASGQETLRALRLRWPDGGELDKESLRAAVRAAAAVMSAAQKASTGPEPTARAEKDLFAALVPEEIVRELDAVERVLVVPDGPLHELPFEAHLVDAARRERWLDRLPPVVYGASATLLAEQRERSRRRRSAPGVDRPLFVGLGDPDFSRSGESGAGSPAHLAAARLRGGFGGLPPLPGTRAEVEAVAALARRAAGGGQSPVGAGEGAVRVLLGEDASAPRLRKAALGPRYLHLATHGLVEGDRKVYESALALAAPAELTAEDNGFLSLGDLLGRWGGRLEGTQLVTLSACRSARGKAASGEGFLALTWGFLFAGAESVVASLWKVDDAATALLMVRFYENLLGRFEGTRELGGRVYASGTQLPKAAALHEAKRWLRQLSADDARKLTGPSTPLAALRGAVEVRREKQPDEVPERPFSAPFFWAAFVLVGDGG